MKIQYGVSIFKLCHQKWKGTYFYFDWFLHFSAVASCCLALALTNKLLSIFHCNKAHITLYPHVVSGFHFLLPYRKQSKTFFTLLIFSKVTVFLQGPVSSMKWNCTHYLLISLFIYSGETQVYFNPSISTTQKHRNHLYFLALLRRINSVSVVLYTKYLRHNKCWKVKSSKGRMLGILTYFLYSKFSMLSMN